MYSVPALSPALRGTVSPKSMQKYEILAIMVNSLNEREALEQVKKSISHPIEAVGGHITFEDFWGARGFAYRIKGEKWGYYACLQFEAEPNEISELKKDWRIDKKLVRVLVTKVLPHMPAPKPYEEMKKEWEALEKERGIKDMTTKTKFVKKATETPASEAPQTEKPKVAKKADVAEKVSHKEAPKSAPAAAQKDIVDKKLDEILSDSSLDL